MANTSQIFKQYLNENSKINCLDGFKLAKKLNVNPIEIANICKKENIKIDTCELGVFGTRNFIEKNEEIYEQLKDIADNENRVPCVDAWKLAQSHSLNKVGSTTKKSDIEVIDCQLGCFRKREHHDSKS